MAGARKSSNSRYRAPNATWLLPTWSRQREELILLNCDNGDGRWRDGDGEVVRATLGDGADDFWWSSSPRDGSGGNDDDWWSSSK
jgi:hypothetical protein